ncbi:MAG: histidine--tRNA ligase [Candidatus Acidiferrales bacterium]
MSEKSAEKSERRQFRAIKGTRDILPADSELWNWFEQCAREVFESYNFRDIRLPIFEEKSLFARAVGTETDIVSKEMFTFEDYQTSRLSVLRDLIYTWEYSRENLQSVPMLQEWLAQFLKLGREGFERGEIPRTPKNKEILDDIKQLEDSIGHRIIHNDPKVKSRKQMLKDRLELFREFELGDETRLEQFRDFELGDVVTLRPEATAGTVRAYVEHGMQTLPGNQKLYYVGPMFRRERPQKGRYRQFYQVGAEVLGPSDAPAIDAEVLEMLVTLFNRVGLANIKLYVNSIGCKECRPKYVELLREKLREVKDQLKEDSQRRIETNPLRVLDSKLPEEQPIIEKLPRISDHLCDACREHFAKLKDELALRAISYEENWRLVRGLDYYTRTTFEVTAAGLGSQNAVCGGGRYDGLVHLLGGQEGIKGIGFAIGTDRAILSMQEGGHLPKLPELAVFIAWMGAKAYAPAVAVAKKLRASGLAVELPPEEMKFKKSLGLADKLGARYALIIGEDEAASGTFTLKRLSDAQQQKLDEAALLDLLQSEFRGPNAR